MQTDVMCAFQVENNDFIVIDGEVMGYVYMVTENDDVLVFDVVDDDGEHTPIPFAPFDTVSIVTAFDDEEVFEEAFDL